MAVRSYAGLIVNKKLYHLFLWCFPCRERSVLKSSHFRPCRQMPPAMVVCILDIGRTSFMGLNC
jgi:hypothetical protein